MNVKRTIIISLAALAGAAALTGCATDQSPVAGVIAAPTRLQIGRLAPDFPVTTADGKETSLGRLREPITIVAFVSPTGDQCCWLNPDLVSLASKLRNRRVTVAQISEPTEKCPHGSGCVATCNLQDPHLLSLCDADRIAWNAYRKPRPNTVVLLDSRGDVAAVSSLSDLRTIAAKAGHLADEVEAFERDAYEGG